jgi:hypothetical protein
VGVLTVAVAVAAVGAVLTLLVLWIVRRRTR